MKIASLFASFACKFILSEVLYLIHPSTSSAEGRPFLARFACRPRSSTFRVLWRFLPKRWSWPLAFRMTLLAWPCMGMVCSVCWWSGNTEWLNTQSHINETYPEMMALIKIACWYINRLSSSMPVARPPRYFSFLNVCTIVPKPSYNAITCLSDLPARSLCHELEASFRWRGALREAGCGVRQEQAHLRRPAPLLPPGDSGNIVARAIFHI